MALGQLVAVASVLYLCWYLLRSRSRLPDPHPGTRHPACLTALPFAGSLPFLPSDPNDMAHQLMEKSKSLGSVFALYFGSTYAVVLNSADSIRDALVKKSSHFADRRAFYISKHYLNVNLQGVLDAAYDEAFRRKHKLYLSIMKQLGFGQRQMETVINANIEHFIVKSKAIGGRASDPTANLTQSVFSIIVSLVFGNRFPYGHPILPEVNEMLRKTIFGFVLQLDFLPLLRFVPPFRGRKNKSVANHQTLLNTLDGMVSDALTNEKERADNVESVSFVLDFIQSTKSPEAGKQKTFTTSLTDYDGVEQPLLTVNYDRQELLYTIRDFLGGGSHTTIAIIRWFLIVMANHPERQSRMQEEVDNVVGQDRPPSLTDEKSMPYSQAVMLETMRRYTILPLSVFHSTTCDTTVGDLFIPAGVMVIVNLYSAHMDSAEWKDPFTFRPERFLDDNGAVYGSDRMMSFSLGKRSCMGETLARQELFLFMARIVQNFDIRPPEGEQQIKYVGEAPVTYEPKPFKVRLISRLR